MHLCRFAFSRFSHLTLFLPLLLILILIAGCAPRENNVQRGNREGVLHVGIGHEPASLDPQLITDTSQQRVLSALFEGLVNEDPRDLHPVPGVAESWTVSPDGLTYTFNLREDARWSNGDPVSAGDFVAAIWRALTPSLAAPSADLLHVLRGARAYHLGRTRDFSRVGIQMLDSHTLRLILETPTPYFLSLLSHPVWYPIHLRSIEANGSPTDRANHWASPGKLIGNGPFILSSWRPDQRILVKKNPEYWAADQVALNAIAFYPIDSLDAEERAFRSGQLHITDALPPARIDAYKADHPELLRIDPYLGVYFLRVNTAREFFNQRDVRLALSQAIDRQAICANILRGGQQAALSFTPPDTAGYTPPAGTRHDPDAARAHLAAAGYPNGQGAPQIELLYNTSESHRQVAEAIQQMWQHTLGLHVRLANQEFGATLQARASGDYDLMRAGWIGDFVDPSTFLELWTTHSTNNFTGWSNSGYDQLIDQAAHATDPLARNAAFRKAETILLAEAPVIPIYHYTHVFLKSPSVSGWYPNLLDHHPYQAVRLKQPPPPGSN